MVSQDEEKDMQVLKRNGQLQSISFDKILRRVKGLGNEANVKINYTSLVMKVIDQLYDGITTTEIDELTAEQCASLITQHPDYGTLASHIIISNHHKNTDSVFFSVMSELYHYRDIHDKHTPIISEKTWEIVQTNREYLDAIVDYSRDKLFDYFGFKTLERAYLMKVNGKIIERPQHMWLRVAIGIHGNNMIEVGQTYHLMSQKFFTHATPTLFNAGTPRPQLSSCYLLSMENDSIHGIYNTLADCAAISKWAGGIGLHIHNVRASGSHIRGTNGSSNGIVPMLRVFNMTARYVDQCFSEDTLIFTKSGLKEIKDVVPEDEIYNAEGQLDSVHEAHHSTYDGEMLDIKTKHSFDTIQVTSEHPFLVLKNQKKMTNHQVIQNRLEKKRIVPEYISANELTCDDLIAYPIPQYTKDIARLSENDFYMIGLMIGDGHISKNSRQAHLTQHAVNNATSLEFVERYLTNALIHTTHTIEDNKHRITWTMSDGFPITRSMIYQADEKIIHPSFLNLPEDKSLALMKGIMESDGHIGVGKGEELTLEMTSRNVINGLRHICLRLGVLTSGYVRDRRGETHESNGKTFTCKKISYVLRIPKTEKVANALHIAPGKFTSFFQWQNLLFSRPTEISKSNVENKTVIDLKMTNDNEPSYVTQMGVCHNGGGKRNGSFAIYLEPWHADIFDFIDLKKNHGDEEQRARDLFYALWIPDLFMERVKADGDWSLMCPDICPGLADCYGEDFKTLYETYEKSEKFIKQVKARDLWYKILDSQMETGTPYILYKDAANKKSNQKNLGTIKSSNLCTEIIEYSDEKETAVCNLASISLSKFVNEKKEFDYDNLHFTTKVVTRNLNKIIDVNFYPTEKTYRSNVLHRPIGIGVQGLADAFVLMDIAYESEEAKEVNKLIFETIYHGALEASNEIAKQRGEEILKHTKDGIKEYDETHITLSEALSYKLRDYKEIEFNNDLPESKAYKTIPDHFKAYIRSMQPVQAELPLLYKTYQGAYSSFENSPASKGLLQFDMWGVKPTDRYDWDQLKESIKEYGLRNSLLVAPMPTASTAQILGNNECFEPFTSNIYTRRTIAGEFIIANKYLISELIELDLWNEQIKNSIIENKGSIQHIEGIPEHIKRKFKIVWEIPMKHMIDMAKDRGSYICQSQSLNLWMEDPNYKALTSMHFYSWKAGLKTGIYYLRRKPKHQPQQFTIAPKKNKGGSDSEDEVCEMCSG